MLRRGAVCCVIGVFAAMAFASAKDQTQSQNAPSSVVIVFRDGHRQSFSMADVARIEFSEPTQSLTASWPAHFVGRWTVGDGAGGKFFITLKRNGEASKSLGGAHGTWIAENGEARIVWDDGWRDAIRKAGGGYEKAAFEPGKTFSDSPSNVDSAKSTEPI